MTDHTPTTEGLPVRVTDASVRECVMYANLLLRGESTSSIGTPLTVEISREYDRWLADRDRKVAAQALRKFVADRKDFEGAVRLLLVGEEDPPKTVADWIRLHARSTADRIEQGGES